MTTTFEARTSLGALIKTFETRKLALGWWLEHSCVFPGCTLDEVETVVTVRRKPVRRARVEVVA